MLYFVAVNNTSGQSSVTGYGSAGGASTSYYSGPDGTGYLLYITQAPP